MATGYLMTTKPLESVSLSEPPDPALPPPPLEAAVTVTLQLAVLLPFCVVTITVVLPVVLPVTLPDWSTEATEGEELLHVTA